MLSAIEVFGEDEEYNWCYGVEGGERR